MPLPGRPTLPGQMSAACALLALGLVAGLAAVLLHGRTWGLALGLAAPAATMWALPPGWWTRGSFALGWAGLVGAATYTRPEGDYLIAADTRGYALLAAAPVVLVAALVTLPRPRRPPDGPGGRGVDA